MKIDITGRNVEITDALEVNIKNKLKRLENHFENIININFILTVEKERMKAEALITIKNGNLFADNENKNMYAAIDEVIIKLDRQLRKQKEKIIACLKTVLLLREKQMMMKIFLKLRHYQKTRNIILIQI